MYSGNTPARTTVHCGGALSPICGVQCGISCGAISFLKRHLKVILCIYGLFCLEQRIRGRGFKGAARTEDLHNREMGAMKAESQARLELPRNLDYKSVGYCMCSTARSAHSACEQTGLQGGRHPEGARRQGLTLFGRLHAFLFLGCYNASIGSALACCLPRCCCVAMPCPLTPGDPTGQRTSPLLTLILCSCHYLRSPVGRYPRSSGSSVMLWGTSGSPRTNGIKQGRNHLPVRDARQLQYMA